ncbi:Endonuclease/exonuclease/phosphatase [Gloeopeniophorella convolvens]|nr:Endonuclease/exonuclease/phosphatase [Gloeopeniophorella convolvens]
MRDHRIAILALQETHLDEALVQNVHRVYGRNLQVFNSPLPVTPRASAGVAFVINRSLITPIQVSSDELYPGRALYIKIKWHEEEETALLNVYAPNDQTENAAFWDTLRARRRSRHLRRPDFVLGDFNVTEEAIDRIPVNVNAPRAAAALRVLRHEWDIIDAWRYENPDMKTYTYGSGSGEDRVLSRLDRIYPTEQSAPLTMNWKHAIPVVQTDHWLVALQYAPLDAPYIGKGRWTWPAQMLESAELIDNIVESGIKMQSEMSKHQNPVARTNDKNPQLLWESFKSEITTMCKKEAKLTLNKRASKRATLAKAIQSIHQLPDFATNDSLKADEADCHSEQSLLQKANAWEEYGPEPTKNENPET